MGWILNLIKEDNCKNILQEVEFGMQQIREIESYAKEFKENLRQEIIENVKNKIKKLPEQEKKDMAFKLYFEYEDIPALAIFDAAGITRQNLKGYIVVRCRDCNEDWRCPIESRAEYQRARKFISSAGHYGECDNCKSKRENARVDKQIMESEWRTSLRSMDYVEFLKTDFWKDVRIRKLKQAKFKCQLCNSGENLNVHHRSYEHHGYEDSHMEDLIVLCNICHGKFHKEGKLTSTEK